MPYEIITNESEKKRLKETIMDIAKEYCDMIDCISDSLPVGLDFEIIRNGFKVKIDAGEI